MFDYVVSNQGSEAPEPEHDHSDPSIYCHRSLSHVLNNLK